MNLADHGSWSAPDDSEPKATPDAWKFSQVTFKTIWIQSWFLLQPI
jgi:hypothetical protein